jgi:hypothetical protein
MQTNDANVPQNQTPLLENGEQTELNRMDSELQQIPLYYILEKAVYARFTKAQIVSYI